MEDKNKQKQTLNSNLKLKPKVSLKPKVVEVEEVSVDLSRRRGSVQVSPPLTPDTPGVGMRGSEEFLFLEDDVGRGMDASMEISAFDMIRKERSSLEEFVFTDSNKINRNAVKYILAKWMILEGKLQETILEKEKLKSINDELRKPSMRTYAQTVAEGVQQKQVFPETMRKERLKVTKEIVLIKPKNEKDDRSNDDIKIAVIRQCDKVKSKIKVKTVRQMRQRG